MKKLNNKGYMLVEIIMASVIAMGIGYYLIDLTYDFVDKNNNLHDSFYMLNTKTVITKNIMNDIYGKDIQGKDISYSIDTNGQYKITFTIKQNTEEQVEEQVDDTDDTMLNIEPSGNEQTTELNNSEVEEKREILIDIKNKTIEYGMINDEDNEDFVKNDISYYKKELDDNINIDSVNYDNSCLKITISNIYLKDTYEIILPIISRQNT